MNLTELQNLYEAIEVGGRFLSPPENIRTKMQNIRCLMFDWDGVFNDGIKGATAHSNFAEADTMGINLLRYGLYLQNKANEMPLQVIITGQKNDSARLVAHRDRFHAVYERALDKSVAFNHVLEQFSLRPEQVAFFFDDVLDLPIASRCGVRVMIRRGASPIFTKFVAEKGYADYLTGNMPTTHALREGTEMLLALIADPYQVFEDRLQFSPTYRTYFEVRNNTIQPQFWEVNDREVNPIS